MQLKENKIKNKMHKIILFIENLFVYFPFSHLYLAFCKNRISYKAIQIKRFVYNYVTFNLREKGKVAPYTMNET